MDGQLNDKVLTDLGEVKGLLHGVTEMIRHSQESTNRRIDDLSLSIHKRMDSVDNRLREVGEKADTAMNLSTDTAARISKHSAFFGGGSGALVAAAIEIIKAVIHH
jgi:hypothetical protein